MATATPEAVGTPPAASRPATASDKGAVTNPIAIDAEEMIRRPTDTEARTRLAGAPTAATPDFYYAYKCPL